MRAVPVLVVVCGGVVGAAARLGVTETLRAGPGGFDWALLAVNTAGLTPSRTHHPPPPRNNVPGRHS